jgi:hypothetical protein
MHGITTHNVCNIPYCSLSIPQVNHHHQPINVPSVEYIGLPYGLHVMRMNNNPLRGLNADWWVLTTANAARANGLTCLPKHGGSSSL